MGSVLGRMFRVMTFGESHGAAIGCVIEGCPSQIPLAQEDIQTFLDRRKPGLLPWTSPRKEPDECEILSGIFEGQTLGTSISITIRNQDVRSHDYKQSQNLYRPGHADLTNFQKYGTSPLPGGGRSSARETAARVAAGAVAKKMLQHFLPDLTLFAYIKRVGTEEFSGSEQEVDVNELKKSPLYAPSKESEGRMISAIEKAMDENDSLGGVITCVITNCPAGLGEPVFDKLEADLAKAMLSIPATRSFELGDGLKSTYRRGSENNDAFQIDETKKIFTKTNHTGGILGGITNGMPIFFSVGFKPVSSIRLPQETVTLNNEKTIYSRNEGRHDPCVLPRAVPIVEAMAWLTLADHFLMQRTQQKSSF